MVRGWKLGIWLAIAAIASAAYWLGALALLDGATSFDYSKGGEPDDGVVFAKAAAVMVLAPLVYAAVLFIAGRRRGARALIAAVGFGVIAGLYWSSVALLLLGATAGDARDGVVVDRGVQRLVLIATLLIAPAVFALMLQGWRRLAGPPAMRVTSDA